MKTKLDGPYLLILAALGLELGCVGRVSDDAPPELRGAVLDSGTCNRLQRFPFD